MPNDYDRLNIRQTNVLKPGASLDGLMNSMTGQNVPEPQTVEVEKIVEVEVVPDGALVRHPDGTIVYKRFVMHQRGIEIPADCDGEEWKDVGYVIRDLDTSISWVIGDWAQYAMKTWGLTAGQIAEMFGYETNTIEVYASICRAVYGLIRNQASTFGHARLVASLNPDLQAKWLTDASANRWTLAQLRQAMKPKPLPGAGWKIPLPGFKKLVATARRKRETRLMAWQEGRLNLTAAEALDEINGLVDFWTAQRESLIEQVSDRDNRTYQE